MRPHPGLARAARERSRARAREQESDGYKSTCSSGRFPPTLWDVTGFFPMRTPSSLRSVTPPREKDFLAAQAGSRDAWEVLRDRYSGPLARHLRLRTGDPTVTRDVVGLAMEVAHKRLAECSAAAEFPRWLRGVADTVAGVTREDE